MNNYNSPQQIIYTSISYGVVVDIDDPQQWGRVRVRVGAYGDTKYTEVNNLPWAMVAAPLMGVVNDSSMQRSGESTDGPVAYGLFNGPELGASALVSCVDGDPMTRVILGFLPIEQTLHTMPHGRYFLDQTKSKKSGSPAGPLSGTEQQIKPLFDNLSKAFAGKKDSYEWRTRGADKSVSALTEKVKNNLQDNIVSSVADDVNVTVTEGDGNKFNRTMGYNPSRIKGKLKPNIYCWVTPGFHAIAMDDSVDNCRMRFRTSTGHQIILDDTNERIYISTNQGENWVEMDSDGSIDVFSSTKVSIHAEGDINLVSNQSIRLDAADGVHIRSETDVAITAINSIGLKTKSLDGIGADAVTFSSNSIHLSGQKEIIVSAEMVSTDGPVARTANPLESFVASRIPQHEPWGRVSSKDNYHRTPAKDYNSPDIGKENKQRNPNWHR